MVLTLGVCVIILYSSVLLSSSVLLFSFSSSPSDLHSLPSFIPSQYSFYTCRYLHILTYTLPDSSKNNLTPHVLSEWMVEVCRFEVCWNPVGELTWIVLILFRFSSDLSSFTILSIYLSIQSIRVGIWISLFIFNPSQPNLPISSTIRPRTN